MISEKLFKKIHKCTKCKTIDGYKKFNTLAHGNIRSKYMLISEAPGKTSINNQKYWTGKSGRLIRSCAYAANIDIEVIFYLTDVVKCWPKSGNGNRPPLENEVANCANFLDKEIEELNPNLILAFGSTAIHYFIKSDQRISELIGEKYIINENTLLFPFIHPGYILKEEKKKPGLRQEYQNQLIKMFEQIRDKSIFKNNG